MKIKGKIQYKEIGMGTWVLVGENGETYELYNPPSTLCQKNLQVTITGKIRNDVMSIAMVGPMLEVDSFQLTGD